MTGCFDTPLSMLAAAGWINLDMAGLPGWQPPETAGLGQIGGRLEPLFLPSCDHNASQWDAIIM